MKLKEVLIRFFKTYNKKIDIKNLVKKFDINDNMIPVLEEVLYELEKDGEIYFDSDETYMHVPEEFYLYHGILKESNTNQGYINLKDGTRILISKKQFNGAKDGDVVFALKNMKKNKHPKCFEGKIVRVVKKEHDAKEMLFIIKGVLKKEGNNYYVKHNDKKIFISLKNINTAYIGDLVNVQIVHSHVGKVIEVLKRHSNKHVFKCVEIDGKLKGIPIGTSYKEYELEHSKCSLGDIIIAEIEDNKLKFINKLKSGIILNPKIETTIIDYGFDIDFPLEVLEEANKISTTIDKESIDKIVDLRNLETFSIDPATAKDLDDAISIEYKNGIYTLYVHIANIAHYVNIYSKIFKEALKRGFSAYPSEYVIHMLPEILSKKVCSLNENNDKLTVTGKIDINSDGKIVDFNIFKSIIHNNKNMSYDKVNKILQDGEIDEEYIPYVNSLIIFNELSNIIQKIRVERGSIFLESNIDRCNLDDVGNPIEMEDNQKGPAQLMIENAMILYNENVSVFSHYLGLPYIYRNHKNPTINKKNRLQYDLKSSGYYIQKLGNIDNPKVLQNFITTLFEGKNSDEVKYLSSKILSSLSRAYYDYENTGHYGLALPIYGTMSSPIRKVSDLINQISVTEFLDNGLNSKVLDEVRKIICESCDYISEKQKDVDFLEQEVNNLLLEEYVEDFVDNEMNAKILFINDDGIYIKTSNGISGVIPLDKKDKIKKNITEYKVGNEVKVVLKEIKKDFIFSIQKSLIEEKKLIKRRDKNDKH